MPETRTYIRPEIPVENIDAVMDSVQEALAQKIGPIGHGAYIGKHEILGVLEQEIYELKKAIYEEHMGIKPVKNELMDIAVACLLGIACIRTGVIK